jgi:hypothetical protein
MRRVVLILVSIGMAIFMFLLSNYRFTPESAALSNPYLTDDFKYVDQNESGRPMFCYSKAM